MYGRRYFRLLVVVATVFLAVTLFMILSDRLLGQLYTVDDKSWLRFILPQKPKHAQTWKLTQDEMVANFPLNELLVDPNAFSPTSLTLYLDPFPLVADKSTDYHFVEQDICRNLKFTGDFQLSKQEYLNADFNRIQEMLANNPEYAKIVKEAKNTFKPTIPEEKQWFRFGGSSVWLREHEVHFMVSRVLYSPLGIPNKSFVSFLYIQLFDKNWKELPPRRLTISYEQNLSKSVVNADGSVNQVPVDKRLDTREVRYPAFLPIPIEYLLHTEDGKYYWGPEDPRILMRHNPLGFEEPIIVFNMKSVKLVKRVMHQYLPFSQDLKVLRKRSEPWANIEKNWTPFISTTNVTGLDEVGTSQLNFIYSIDPLEILSCEIDTGVCDFLQKPQKDDYDYVGPLRGGTQLVKLPFEELVPSHIQEQVGLPENRQIYIGWARAHLNKCGCGESMYRPNLMVLVEDYNPVSKKFYYKLGAVSEYFDFHANVPGWTIPTLDENGQLVEEVEPAKCAGRNVLIPNSIAYWSIESIVKDKVAYRRKYFHKIPTDEQLDDKKASKVHKISSKRDSSYPLFFNDFMGVTLSAADADVSIVHVNGLLNYIISIPSLFDENTVVQDDSMFQPRGYVFNNKCAMVGSQDYCVAYAEANGGVTEYEEESA